MLRDRASFRLTAKIVASSFVKLTVPRSECGQGAETDFGAADPNRGPSPKLSNAYRLLYLLDESAGGALNPVFACSVIRGT